MSPGAGGITPHAAHEPLTRVINTRIRDVTVDH
jgi:hypothetical protein